MIIFEKISDNAIIPSHAYGNQHESVGMDFYASESPVWSLISEGIYSCVVKTGLKVQLPENYHLRIASRSGLGFKKNVLAFPGTIDNSYRGEIMIKLFAFSDGYPETILSGEKIAQGIVFQSHDYEIVEGIVSEDTSRSSKGFGSSG